MNRDDARWDDPDFARDGSLIGEEEIEVEYNADDDPDWGKHDEEAA